MTFFTSKRWYEDAIYFGVEIIYMFKTNTKCFCKDTIKAPEKDWLVGSYLVLKRKSTVPGNRPLIAISYKYNV